MLLIWVEHRGGGINVSSPDARVFLTEMDDSFHFVTPGNVSEGTFFYGYGYENINNSTQCITYAYLDKPTTVSGTSSSNGYTYTGDCTFTKGWNVVYVIENYKTNSVTFSTNSSIVNTNNMKWYFIP